MLEILRLLSIPLVIVMLYVLIKLWLRGPAVIPELARSGFSLKAYLTGRGLHDNAGSSIRKTKGLVAIQDEDGLEISETINLSSGRL
jgi:hypothetical protein